MVKKIQIILGMFFLAGHGVFSFGDEVDLNRVLSSITVSLEQKKAEDVSLMISREFLNAITNEVNQSQILGYTSDWINKHGDVFPESMLLHCLAGGDMEVIQKQYDQFNNIVSKNYARWCLMVRDEPLEQRITSQSGKYYSYEDYYTRYRAIVRRNGNQNSLHKCSFIKKKKWQRRPIVVMDYKAIVLRADGVPVPWGLYRSPDIFYIPFEVARETLEKKFPWGRAIPARFGGNSFGIAETVPVCLSYGRMAYSDRNLVWGFFLENLPPLIFIAGQPISIVNTNTPFSGEIRHLTRIIISKEKEKEAFYNDLDIEQDILVSSPIEYRVEFFGGRPEIEWLESGGRVSPR